MNSRKVTAVAILFFRMFFNNNNNSTAIIAKDYQKVIFINAYPLYLAYHIRVCIAFLQTLLAI